LILSQILGAIDKREKLKMMNMAISSFFSEVGTDLISVLSGYNLNLNDLQEKLIIEPDWGNARFKSMAQLVKGFNYNIDSKKGDLYQLKMHMHEKRAFLLLLLENPNLLEHDSFTDLLWAIFHVIDELDSRDGFTDLPESDFKHLSGDMKRAYILLLFEWLHYMEYLKNRYPYLYSLATRKNPFNPNASVIIR
jgi:hypothetical protein